MDLAARKKALRERVRRLVGRMSPGERARRSRLVCRRLVSLPEFRAAESVLLYYPLPDEVDLRPVFDEAFALGKTLLLPRTDPEKGVEPLVVRPEDLEAMSRDPLGVPVPAGCAVFTGEGPGFVAVPGRAFDRSMRRLGRGKGFYDRFLGSLPQGAVVVGVAFSRQVVPEVPAGPSDRKVGLVVCEDEVIRP